MTICLTFVVAFGRFHFACSQNITRIMSHRFDCVFDFSISKGTKNLYSCVWVSVRTLFRHLNAYFHSEFLVFFCLLIRFVSHLLVKDFLRRLFSLPFTVDCFSIEIENNTRKRIDFGLFRNNRKWQILNFVTNFNSIPLEDLMNY